MVNKMSGKPEKTKHFSLERNGETLNDEQLASALNEFYVSVNADIPTFDVNLLPGFLPSNDASLSVQPYEVCQKLLALQPYKATGPDNVPSRFLKDFAYLLADPVTAILPIIQLPSRQFGKNPISFQSRRYNNPNVKEIPDQYR